MYISEDLPQEYIILQSCFTSLNRLLNRKPSFADFYILLVIFTFNNRYRINSRLTNHRLKYNYKLYFLSAFSMNCSFLIAKSQLVRNKNKNSFQILNLFPVSLTAIIVGIKQFKNLYSLLQ